MRDIATIKEDINAALDVSDVESVIRLAEELSRIGSSEADANALWAQGTAAVMTGDNTRALEHYRRSLAIFEQINDRAGWARITASMAGVYHARGDFALALEHNMRALPVYQEFGFEHGVAGITVNIANIYSATSDYGSALESYRRALAIFERINDAPGIARTTISMGGVHKTLGEYPQALECFRRSLAGFTELGDRFGIARATNSLGSIYDAAGDLENAREYYTRALELVESTRDRASLSIILDRLGMLELQIGNAPRAIEYLKRSLAVEQQLGNREGLARTTCDLAAAYLSVGDHDNAAILLDGPSLLPIANGTVLALFHANKARLRRHRGDHAEAHRHLQTALSIASDIGARSMLADLHIQLRDLADERNDLAAYVQHNKAYEHISKDIHGRGITQRLAMIEAERRVDTQLRERERERAVLHAALPRHVADRVVRGERVTGDHFDVAAVIFADIVGFTPIAERVSPAEMVALLDDLFSRFDEIAERYDITKIKTIGDCYMAVAFDEDGVTRARGVAERAAHAAIDMMNALNRTAAHDSPRSAQDMFHEVHLRIGIHIGPLTAGVIGTQRLQYDVWGDTVNVASRMESHGEPGRIHVSEAFADAVKGEMAKGREGEKAEGRKGEKDVEVILRGTVDIKGKGAMTTYWLA